MASISREVHGSGEGAGRGDDELLDVVRADDFADLMLVLYKSHHPAAAAGGMTHCSQCRKSTLSGTLAWRRCSAPRKARTSCCCERSENISSCRRKALSVR